MIPEFVRYIAAAVVVIGLLIWYIPRKNEWGQVIELSEYTSILCARQTLKELVTTDVETCYGMGSFTYTTGILSRPYNISLYRKRY